MTMHPIKRTLQLLLLTVAFAFISSISFAQKFAKFPVMSADWSKDYKPFRIVGNLYYVGTYDLACYLITTPQGHILINSGLAESVPMIRAHVEAMGFKFSDIKILLATHAHYDHVGAMADIKKMTGAKMMINENDAPVLADGGKSDYAFGENGSTFEALTADRLLHEQDTVKLGGMNVIVLHHPGHTKGACSFLFDVKDNDRSYRVLIANLPSVLDQTNLSGMPTYPNVAKDYAYTFDALKNLQFDIFLASHAGQFDMHKKHQPDDAYNPQVFIDRKGYDLAVDNLHRAYLRRLGK